MRALVVGGGIGGLSAAVALQRAGIEPRVFEQAPELREIGAGLSIWSNGVAALRYLGLADVIGDLIVPIRSIETRRTDGRVLQTLPIERLDREVGAPSVGFHRRELLGALAEAVPDELVTTGAPFERFDQDAKGVVAFFGDGSDARGDFLVGADGIFSTVRSQITTAEEPRFGGYVVWRGVASLDPTGGWPSHASVRTMSRDQHFGIIELTGGRFFWYATRNQSKDEPEAGGRKATLLRHFGDWHPPIRQLLEATPEGEMLRNGLYRLPPLRRWTSGRVTLVGDAAHPMAPSLGQGACQAIEDAVALGHALGEETDPARALQVYESRRLKRARSIVRWSRFFAMTEQFRNPVLCTLRDLQTSLVPQRVALRMWKPFVSFAPPAG